MCCSAYLEVVDSEFSLLGLLEMLVPMCYVLLCMIDAMEAELCFAGCAGDDALCYSICWRLWKVYAVMD